MDRIDFLKYTSLGGIGLGIMPSLLQSCSKEDDIDINFNGKVLIIGAGAAGMMTAYTLSQYNIDYTLIEATTNYGGRVKKTDSFTDFPIDLGAEWIHDKPKVFGELINDENVDGNIDLISYQPESIYFWNNNSLTETNLGSHFYREYKFKRTTWYDFFEDFIIPKIEANVTFDRVVESIDYNGDKVEVLTDEGQTFIADKVIVTVPIKVLQSDMISFNPTLPTNIKKTIDEIYVPPGLKVFIEFSERFYPDLISVSSIAGVNGAEKTYYNAAFKKDSNKNILALFQVGKEASELTDLTNDEIIASVLAELDEMFDGKASSTYVNHVVQNWVSEPHIQGAYTFLELSQYEGTSEISRGLNNKVYFAGEAYHQQANATVHGAAFTGRDIAKTIIAGG